VLRQVTAWLAVRERAGRYEADNRARRAREDQAARRGLVVLLVRCVDGVHRPRDDVGFPA
jgi:hypothetical protein